jgi:hypothetical protein
VPAGFGPKSIALVADRGLPGAPHPGDDAVLAASGSALHAAGVRPGDLLFAAEGGGPTDDFRCAATSCAVREVATGPDKAHIEGHIEFLP